MCKKEVERRGGNKVERGKEEMENYMQGEMEFKGEINARIWGCKKGKRYGKERRMKNKVY